MRKVMVALGSVFIAGWVSAALITFDFDDPGPAGADLNGKHSASTTNSGVVLTAVAGAAAGDLFNQTATYFGINASGTGDDTDQFDGGSGVDEFMTFSFNTNGTLLSMDFAALDTLQSDTGLVVFAATSSTNIFYNNNTDGSDVLSLNQSFSAGDQITIAYKEGNGFALEGITISVPEPTPAILLLMAALSLRFFRKLII